MSPFFYLYKRTLANRIRMALNKPATYIFAVLIVVYAIFAVTGVASALIASKNNTTAFLVMLLSAFAVFLSPPSYNSYARHKGLIFTPPDVHFIFSSPVSPKLVLIYAMIKSLAISFFLELGVFLLGIIIFNVFPPRMLLYAVVAFAVDSILQTGIVIVLYGNERLSDNTVRWIGRILWIFTAALFVLGAWFLYNRGFTLDTARAFLDSPYLQAIPIFGWNVALIRLILLGPDTVNVIFSVLYIMTALLFLLTAKRMKCTGQYYEDAMKFADDYEEARRRKKKGEMATIGGRKKYRSASVAYHGSGAKAIYYRQLLEYKKNRFFIFGVPTLIFLAAGLFFAYMFSTGRMGDMGGLKYFLVPGIIMYIDMIFSGFQTKWEKELESPYTFLLPDSPVKKLWYSTVIEHIRAGVDGFLMALPVVIAARLPFWYVVIYTLAAMCLGAVKVYAATVCRVLLGNVLGENIKSFLRLIITWTVVGISIPITAAFSILVNPVIGLLAGCFYLVLLTSGLFAAGTFAFTRMEIQDAKV